MKKRISAALLMALCVAVMACAVGCSSNDNEKVVGSWTVVGINAGDEVLTGDDLELIGKNMTFVFNEDGTCSLDTAGVVADGTWELKGDDLTITMSDETMSGKVTDNSIVIEDEMTLERTTEGYQG